MRARVERNERSAVVIVMVGFEQLFARGSNFNLKLMAGWRASPKGLAHQKRLALSMNSPQLLLSLLPPHTMSTPCVTQARIFAVKGRDASEELPTISSSWSLPVWILPMESNSLAEQENPAILLHSRIASPLGIEDGDDVVFELVSCGERFKREVTVVNDLEADFVVNDALSTEICISAGVSSKTRKGITSTTTKLKLHGSEVELSLPGQDLWTRDDCESRALQGSGILHFNGASRSDGTAGFGYSISTASTDSESSSSPTIGPDLVNGYCFGGSGNNIEMEFAGLLEGLTWALRFDFEKLWIRGDSLTVIQKMNGDVVVKEDEFVEYFYFTKIQALLEEARDKGTEILIQHVKTEQNVIANVLANLAIDLKENATACNWENINVQCRRRK